MYAIPRKYLVFPAGLSLVVAAVALPASAGLSAQMGELPLLSYDVPAAEAAAAAESAVPAPAATVRLAAVPARPAHDAAAIECMAKVVHHEAKNQPRRGQLAVAQAMVNRLHDGRFGDSICEVAAQRGQFFNVAAYHPRQDTVAWDDAVEVAREALGDTDEQVAPGALFFRASYAPANTFFRGRQRVTQVGAHIFYR